jgi:hypothetical protein
MAGAAEHASPGGAGADGAAPDGAGGGLRPLGASDEFFMWKFKIVPCRKRTVHDW